MYKVTNTKPLPKARRRYPFAKMKVGDSCYVPFGERTYEKARLNTSSAAYTWGFKHGRKFTVRREGEGIRVWRIV